MQVQTPPHSRTFSPSKWKAGIGRTEPPPLPAPGRGQPPSSFLSLRVGLLRGLPVSGITQDPSFYVLLSVLSPGSLSMVARASTAVPSQGEDRSAAWLDHPCAAVAQ